MAIIPTPRFPSSPSIEHCEAQRDSASLDVLEAFDMRPIVGPEEDLLDPPDEEEEEDDDERHRCVHVCTGGPECRGCYGPAYRMPGTTIDDY